VDAYRAALDVFTPQTTPNDWARAQHDLGTTLRILEERNSSPAELEAAVAAYAAALEVYGRGDTPLEWARAQSALGSVLLTQAERGSIARSGRLEAAVGRYSSALQVFTREETPLEWAETQANLGNALRLLGEVEPGTTRLTAAAEAYSEALEVDGAHSLGAAQNLELVEEMIRERSG